MKKPEGRRIFEIRIDSLLTPVLAEKESSKGIERGFAASPINRDQPERLAPEADRVDHVLANAQSDEGIVSEEDFRIVLYR
jgi:hypothetical protein